MSAACPCPCCAAQAVVQRLEAESAAALRDAQAEWARREEALDKKLAASAREAKKQEARWAAWLHQKVDQ